MNRRSRRLAGTSVYARLFQGQDKSQDQSQSQKSKPHYCDCPNGWPLMATMPGQGTLPDEKLRLPERYHRLWHQITRNDREWFNRHPDMLTRERPFIKGEAWPHEPAGAVTTKVIRLNQLQQARSFWDASGKSVS
jgi:hypothetical protein